MYNRFMQFQVFYKRSRQIAFLISLDLLFTALTLISTFFRTKNLGLLTIPFLLVDFLLLIITIIYYAKNLIYIKDFKDYFINKSNGTNTEKPDPSLIEPHPDEALRNIRKLNVNGICQSPIEKIYETNAERILFPAKIASDLYSSILIHENELILQGAKDTEAEISLVIPDNHRCRLIFDSLSLVSRGNPAIYIGRNCHIELILQGDNFLKEEGIRIPEGSELVIAGDGNLTIVTEDENKVCLGGSSNHSYGNITLASQGTISLSCHGKAAVGIGGGNNPSNSLIRLVSGNISIDSTGSISLGIGSISGNSRIMIEDCVLKLNTKGNKTVGIGSITGNTDIITSGILEIKSDGKNAVCIGTIEAGGGFVTVREGTLNLRIRTHTGTGIGSIYGEININVLNGEISIYGEGAVLAGIGDHDCSSFLQIHNGILSVLLYATDVRQTGCRPGGFIIDGGNIQCDFTEDQMPVNSYGTPLSSHIVSDKDEFCQRVETVSYSYLYRASYSSRHPFIKVYLPENIVCNTL